MKVCSISTGTRWSFCGNQSKCRICRICILIGECCNGVEPWRYWNMKYCLERLDVTNDWNVWNIWNALGRSCSWNAWNAFGRSCRMNGCTRRSLCLLHVELDSGLKSSLSSGVWIWSSVWSSGWVPE